MSGLGVGMSAADRIDQFASSVRFGRIVPAGRTSEFRWAGEFALWPLADFCYPIEHRLLLRIQVGSVTCLTFRGRSGGQLSPLTLRFS